MFHLGKSRGENVALAIDGNSTAITELLYTTSPPLCFINSVDFHLHLCLSLVTKKRRLSIQEKKILSK